MIATLNITELQPEQIFVFGSNLNGWHLGGAARQAQEKFGAVNGIGVGIQGQSYAIPTLGLGMAPMQLDTIKYFIEEFKKYAENNSDKEFLLTPIGTGIAGFSLQEIKSILPGFSQNVKFVGNWEE